MKRSCPTGIVYSYMASTTGVPASEAVYVLGILEAAASAGSDGAPKDLPAPAVLFSTVP
jgi:hypothetical protein